MAGSVESSDYSALATPSRRFVATIFSGWRRGATVSRRARQSAAFRVRWPPPMASNITETLGNEVDQIAASYEASFAGQSRATRNLDELDRLIARTKAVL